MSRNPIIDNYINNKNNENLKIIKTFDNKDLDVLMDTFYIGGMVGIVVGGVLNTMKEYERSWDIQKTFCQNIGYCLYKGFFCKNTFLMCFCGFNYPITIPVVTIALINSYIDRVE